MIFFKTYKFFFFLITASLFAKFFFAPIIYTEVDDLISINQVRIYKDVHIYDIANDVYSPSYNSNIKKNIRNIEKLNNASFDLIFDFLSFILKRVSPSKHSTFAPLQYFLFADLLKTGNSYKEIKFYSRVPSIIFATLSILVTYLIATKIFLNQNKLFAIIPVSILAFSYPVLYISLRSYNYSAGMFAVICLFYLIYIQLLNNSNNKFNISNAVINLRLNFLIAFLISVLSYLSYVIFFLSPLFFFILVVRNFFNKKIFCKYNYNLIIIGIFYTAFSSPLLIHMLILELNEYGVTASPAGDNYEYYYNFFDNTFSFLNFFSFYINNTYLVIVKNLSFFLDTFNYSAIFQLFIFIFFTFGCLTVFLNKDRNIKFFLFIFYIFASYYLILTFFGIVTLGPTRHLNVYTPIISIVFSLGFYNLIKIFKFKKINFLIYTFSIFIFFIFLLNSISFLKKYEDPFNEEKISKILEFNKVGFVVNDPAYSDSLCIMKKVYMISEISTCYENKYPRSRYSLILNINDNLLLDLKNKNLGIAFINKEISVQELFLLKRYNFIKSETIENIKFTNNSPLYISKYVPNYFRMIIYK
jgi:hypothetical protein